MSMVYVIVGCAGKYESYEEWFVRAYTDENRAKQEVERLNECSKSFMGRHPRFDFMTLQERDSLKADHIFDPEYQADSEYEYRETELVTA